MNQVLNFGSLNIDYVYSVDHFVAPGETLTAEKREVFPGGKGLNQSVALAAAKASVWHAGKTGADGLWLGAKLTEAGVNISLLETVSGPTGHALIEVAKTGQNRILLFPGANAEMERAYIDRVLENFGTGDLLVLQNEINDIRYIAEKGWERGMRLAFNPSPMDARALTCPLEKVTWLLLNEVEGEQLTGEKQPEAQLNKLLQRYPQLCIVLTLGSEGAIYRDAQQECHQPIFRVPVVDTTAAGDTFTGFFLAARMRGEKVEKALRTAAVASAIVVSRKGASVSIPTIKEVQSRLVELTEPF